MQTKINNNFSFFKHIFAICCIVSVQVASVLSGGVGGVGVGGVGVGATGVVFPSGVTTVFPVGTVTQCPANSPLACGASCYSSNQFVCIDAAAGIMCPVTAPNRCGAACYSTSQYVCTIGGNLCSIDDLSCRGIAGTGVISTSKPIAGTVYQGATVYDQPQYATGYASGVVYPASAGAVYPANGYTNGGVVYPASATYVNPGATTAVVYPAGNSGVVYPAAAAGGVVYQQPETYVTQTAVYPTAATTKPNVYYTNGNGAGVAGTAVYPAGTTVIGGQAVYPAGVGATAVYPTTVYPTGSKQY